MIHERLSNGNANKIDNIGYHSIIIDIVQKLPDNYHPALKILIGNLTNSSIHVHGHVALPGQGEVRAEGSSSTM